MQDVSRKNPIRQTKFIESKNISNYQKLLLSLLAQDGALFLIDFMQITNLGKKQLDLVLSSLYKRELVKRANEYNKNTSDNYKHHFRYEVSKKGKELLMLSIADTPFDYKGLLKSVQARYIQDENDTCKKKAVNIYINIGKNQLAVLRIFKEQAHPLFLLDFISLTTIPQKAIDNSLTHLYRRGYLSRKKVNNNSYTGNIQHAKQFRYGVTKKGHTLIKIKLG